MIVKEIKAMEEVVKRIEYIAKDGTVFDSKTECAKYESTCECVIRSAYKKLVVKSFTEYDLFECGSDENYYDIVKVNTIEDLNALNKMIKYYDEKMPLYETETIGHETLVGWVPWTNLPSKEGNIGTILNKIAMNYVKIYESKGE